MVVFLSLLYFTFYYDDDSLFDNDSTSMLGALRGCWCHGAGLDAGMLWAGGAGLVLEG
jgi:hypothetical protein